VVLDRRRRLVCMRQAHASKALIAVALTLGPDCGRARRSPGRLGPGRQPAPHGPTLVMPWSHSLPAAKRATTEGRASPGGWWSPDLLHTPTPAEKPEATAIFTAALAIIADTDTPSSYLSSTHLYSLQHTPCTQDHLSPGLLRLSPILPPTVSLDTPAEARQAQTQLSKTSSQ
jgi:hypothetical protein